MAERSIASLQALLLATRQAHKAVKGVLHARLNAGINISRKLVETEHWLVNCVISVEKMLEEEKVHAGQTKR